MGGRGAQPLHGTPRQLITGGGTARLTRRVHCRPNQEKKRDTLFSTFHDAIGAVMSGTTAPLNNTPLLLPQPQYNTSSRSTPLVLLLLLPCHHHHHVDAQTPCQELFIIVFLFTAEPSFHFPCLDGRFFLYFVRRVDVKKLCRGRDTSWVGRKGHLVM